MKKTVILTFTLLTFLSFSDYKNTSNKVPIKTSKLLWKGYKLTSFHEGEVALKSGFFMFSAGRISGGEFIVDMTSIKNTDLKGGWKTKLENHIKSDDFFYSTKYPDAKLVFKKVKYLGARKYDIAADLTIRGITNPIKFKITQSINKEFHTQLKINRTLYKIEYNSGSFFENLGDKLIKNIFDLDITLTI